MVVKNTHVFIEKFEKAAKEAKLSYAYGKVHYDLDEKLSDIEYYDLAMKDCFESVFHKIKEGYEIQNEVRFALICPDKPDHIKPKTKMLFIEWKQLFNLAHDDISKQQAIIDRKKSLEELLGHKFSDRDDEYLSLYALQTAYESSISGNFRDCKKVDNANQKLGESSW